MVALVKCVAGHCETLGRIVLSSRLVIELFLLRQRQNKSETNELGSNYIEEKYHRENTIDRLISE